MTLSQIPFVPTRQGCKARFFVSFVSLVQGVGLAIDLQVIPVPQSQLITDGPGHYYPVCPIDWDQVVLHAAALPRRNGVWQQGMALCETPALPAVCGPPFRGKHNTERASANVRVIPCALRLTQPAKSVPLRPGREARLAPQLSRIPAEGGERLLRQFHDDLLAHLGARAAPGHPLFNRPNEVHSRRRRPFTGRVTSTDEVARLPTPLAVYSTQGGR